MKRRIAPLSSASARGVAMLFVSATNYLLGRRVVGVSAFLSPIRTTILMQQPLGASCRRGFHQRPYSLPLMTCWTTRLKQSSNSEESSNNTIDPTWVYTPYKPKPRNNNNNSRRYFSSSDNKEWKVPDIIPLPEDQLEFNFVRSSGSGGQNVNKLNTKVEIRFHVPSASWLPSEVRQRLQTNESNRINNEGYFTITCQEHRTQIQNRKIAIQKLRDILRECWKRPKVRKMREGLSQKTKENRMEMKRRTAEKKARRGKVDF
eukprot:scaffold39440_cov63-Cyclotella_meneghiniana.AAC.7